MNPSVRKHQSGNKEFYHSFIRKLSNNDAAENQWCHRMSKIQGAINQCDIYYLEHYLQSICNIINYRFKGNLEEHLD